MSKSRTSPSPAEKWTRGRSPARVAAFRRAVAAQLRPRSAKLTAVLRKLISHPYPEDFWQLDFELDGMTEFDRDACIGAYFFREGFDQVCEGRRVAAHYPIAVAERLLKMPLRFPASLIRKSGITADEAWPCYAAEEETIRWFHRCWRAAGGDKFRFRAIIGVHDAAEQLDLMTGEWTKDS